MSKKMKWYKFIIYFQLWCSAVFNLVTFAQYFTGNIYSERGIGVYPELIYLTFPDLSVIDKMYAIFALVAAVYAIYVRGQLAKFRRNAPERYILYYVIFLVGAVLYSIISGTIIGSMPISISIIPTIIGCLIYVAFNKEYFDERKDLFVN